MGELGYRIIAVVLVLVLAFITVLGYVLNKKTKKPDCAKPEKEKCLGCKFQESCKLFKDE